MSASAITGPSWTPWDAKHAKGAALGEMLVPLLVASLYRVNHDAFIYVHLAASLTQLATFAAAWRLGGRLKALLSSRSAGSAASDGSTGTGAELQSVS